MRGARIASVVGITILILSMIAFGVPYPSIQQSGVSETGETDPVPVEMQVYDEHTAVEDADAIPPLLIAAAGGAVAGYVAGEFTAEYTSANPESQLEAAFAANNMRTNSNTTSSIINGSTDEARLMAYSKAEATFAKSLAKNESLATAQTKAVEEVRDYLAQAQYNEIVVRNEQYLPSFMRIHENDGITVTDTATTCSSLSGGGGADQLNSLETTTSTLVNGTTVDHGYINYDNCNAGVEGKFSLINGGPGLRAEVDDSDLDDRIVISSETMQRFSDSWTEFESIETEVVNEIDTFAQNVDPADYANLDPSDIVSPTTAATQFGDAYDETQNPQFAAALAEQLGLDTQANLTDSVTIDINGTNRTGVIYGDYDELGGNISVGDSYSDELAAWLETQNGTVDLSKYNWTVEKISDGDGGTKTTLELSRGSQPSLSADDPLKRIQIIRERRENLGNESFWGGLTGGFGGGGLFGGSAPFGIPWIVWIIAGLGVFLAATRS